MIPEYQAVCDNNGCVPPSSCTPCPCKVIHFFWSHDNPCTFINKFSVCPTCVFILIHAAMPAPGSSQWQGTRRMRGTGCAMGQGAWSRSTCADYPQSSLGRLWIIAEINVYSRHIGENFSKKKPSLQILLLYLARHSESYLWFYNTKNFSDLTKSLALSHSPGT